MTVLHADSARAARSAVAAAAKAVVDPIGARPKARVLHMITHLALGGAERVAFDLIRGLQKDFEFAVYAARGVEPGCFGRAMREELGKTGTPLFTGTGYPVKLGGAIVAGLRCAEAVRLFRPNLIHLHTEIPEFVYAVGRGLRREMGPIPVVRTIHNGVYWAWWRRLGVWCDRRLSDARVACVSEAARNAFLELREESRAQPPTGMPTVIYNGVDVASEHGVRRAAPTHGCVRALYAGRFDHQKGTDLLPEIIGRAELPPGCGGVLELYGCGPHESLLKDFAAKPPKGWTVSVNPPDPYLRQQLDRFDVVLMPSRFEGLGLVAVEALVAGLPVVVTHIPGLSEVVPDDYPLRACAESAASFAGTLSRLIRQPQRFSRDVERARAFAVKRFNSANMYKGYADLYRSALMEVPENASGPVTVPSSLAYP